MIILDSRYFIFFHSLCTTKYKLQDVPSAFKQMGVPIQDMLSPFKNSEVLPSVDCCEVLFTCDDYTDKTSIPFPFTLNGIWSWWQFSFQFWTKWISIWSTIERKTVTTIISHSMWKEMEYLFSQCIEHMILCWAAWFKC